MVLNPFSEKSALCREQPTPLRGGTSVALYRHVGAETSISDRRRVARRDRESWASFLHGWIGIAVLIPFGVITLLSEPVATVPAKPIAHLRTEPWWPRPFHLP